MTVQQFRRTLKMITAAEFLRIDNSSDSIGWRPSYSNLKGDWIYGSTRFSTGLWVGGAVSPLHLVKKGGAMDLLKGIDVKDKYSSGEPAQILKCPVCGSWLSVPKSGLNDKINKLHIVIEADSLSQIDIEKIMKDTFKDDEVINYKNISANNHKAGYYTVSFEIMDKFSREQFEEKLVNPILEYGIEVASLSPFNIGYFTSLNHIKRTRVDAEGDFDFEIWCTNPECDLNNVKWEEGCPYPNGPEPDFPDGNYKRNLVSPFMDDTRMPIPAYIIDDQVYNRCPTVIISTADKIARLAFEPRASAIFGNVNNFNKYYGYNRNGLFPKECVNVLKYNKVIEPLKTPDLIIQDELHLIEGPLGSLFGLYEAMMSAIIEKQGGNPKYIASTATISNAQKQVDLLFSKKLYQFPPHGLDITDNFFVKDYESEEAWNEEKPGRLYLGVYAPGKGPMTPQIKLWGRLLKTAGDNLDDSMIKNFWTVVAYYNSIRELGGALAMYRDDMKNRLRSIIDLDYNKKLEKIENGTIEEEIELNYRELDEENKQELSSRIDSTELPLILDNLEQDGINDIPKYDAIFTTSMFGTGVDISHLSLMIMTSQPKTTGSYIQATGRIGRKNGGLIVDFLKSGRPRDLNHYEMFPSYHSKIYLDVEPVSVSPFSRGCLSRGLGPNEILGGYFLYPSSDGKNVTVYERGYNRVRTFKIDDFLEERLTNPISSSTINTGGLNLAPVGSNFIIGKPQKDLNLFSLIGENGETINRFGNFPSEMMEGFETDDTFLHMQIQLLVSSNKDKQVAVAAGYMSDILCFYQIDDKGNAKLLNQYRTYDTELDLSFSENGASAKYNDHTMDAYNSLYPTGAHLYALYRGCLMNSHKEHPYTYVQVFDWDGNFVKGYKLDAPVADIAVDEDRGIIYGLYAGGDPHVRVYQMN